LASSTIKNDPHTFASKIVENKNLHFTQKTLIK
jgi:hypothetical protein